MVCTMVLRCLPIRPSLYCIMYAARIGGPASPSMFADCNRSTNRLRCAGVQLVVILCHMYLTMPSRNVWRMSMGVSCEGSYPVATVRLRASNLKEMFAPMKLSSRLTLLPGCKWSQVRSLSATSSGERSGSSARAFFARARRRSIQCWAILSFVPVEVCISSMAVLPPGYPVLPPGNNASSSCSSSISRIS